MFAFNEHGPHEVLCDYSIVFYYHWGSVIVDLITQQGSTIIAYMYSTMAKWCSWKQGDSFLFYYSFTTNLDLLFNGLEWKVGRSCSLGLDLVVLCDKVSKEDRVMQRFSRGLLLYINRLCGRVASTPTFIFLLLIGFILVFLVSLSFHVLAACPFVHLKRKEIKIVI